MEVRPAVWRSDPDSLDDVRWEACPPAHLVDVRNGAAPLRPTEVRLASATDVIWIRFACTADTIRATMTKYKDKVWQEGAVEVYIRPPGTDHLFEFQLSPIGTFRDLKVWNSGLPNQRYDDMWNCSGATTDARIDRSASHAITGWRATFGLPWVSLSSAAPGADGWRIGLFRIDYEPQEYTGLVSCQRDEPDLHDRRLLVPLVGPGSWSA